MKNEKNYIRISYILGYNTEDDVQKVSGCLEIMAGQKYLHM